MPRTTVRLRKGVPPDLEGLKPSGDAWRHDNIGRLLIVAFHAFGERVVQGIHESGHPEIRFVHLNLFRTVDYAQGTRLVDLARRNGIGKAAMGQLAREGERLGLFSITSDANDGRAKIVRITAKGRALHKVIRRELLKSEREFATLLGRNRYAALREGLLTLRRKLAERFPSGFSQEEQLTLPLYSVVLNRSIMRPSSTVPRTSYSRTASG